MSMWGEYVSVSERRARAKKAMDKLRKKGEKIEPVQIEGRNIAQEFWGKRWCDHLETFADYDNRLPRGRTYARNGSVCHLAIQEGSLQAIVSGSELYKVTVTIKLMAKEKWERIKKRCSGHIGSLLELLQGKISHQVMEVVSDHKEGLFPTESEIDFECDCYDWADLCKHVAAVLYGVAHRLDDRPELLFLLRGVDASELVESPISVAAVQAADQLDSGDLTDIFGIDLADAAIPFPTETSKEKTTPQKAVRKKYKEQNTASNIPVLDMNSLTGGDMRLMRERMGMTVIEFADALAVTPPSVYRWEQQSALLRLQQRCRDALKRLYTAQCDKS